MVLTRAASHGRGAGHACDRLGRLEESGGRPDPALYNFVLDACILQETLPTNDFASNMQARFGQLYLVSYNTLLKSTMSSGSFTAAFGLLPEMD